MQPPCRTAHNKRLTPALTLRRSDRLLSSYLLAVSTEHYYIYPQHYGTEISTQNSWISSLLMVDFTAAFPTQRYRGGGAACSAVLSCALSDYFRTVLSGGRVTALSIYVKRLGDPEIRNRALKIMQSRPRCLSLHVAFISLAGFQIKQSGNKRTVHRDCYWNVTESPCYQMDTVSRDVATNLEKKSKFLLYLASLFFK